MRDKGDMVTVDFNGAAAHLENVLDDLIDREENKPRVHVIHAYPNSPEIVTILFLYEPELTDEKRHELKRACFEEAIFRYVLVYHTLMSEEVMLHCVGFLHYTITFRHHNEIAVVHRNPWVLCRNEEFGL